jgi:hypothetical protein
MLNRLCRCRVGEFLGKWKLQVPPAIQVEMTIVARQAVGDTRSKEAGGTSRLEKAFEKVGISHGISCLQQNRD